MEDDGQEMMIHFTCWFIVGLRWRVFCLSISQVDHPDWSDSLFVSLSRRWDLGGSRIVWRTELGSDREREKRFSEESDWDWEPKNRCDIKRCSQSCRCSSVNDVGSSRPSRHPFGKSSRPVDRREATRCGTEWNYSVNVRLIECCCEDRRQRAMFSLIVLRVSGIRRRADQRN